MATPRVHRVGDATVIKIPELALDAVEGLFNLVRGLPATLKYESGVIVADGDFVIVHGRFSGFGAPANWIAADILRIQEGVLVEHWDVIQDEATRDQSRSGRPMFGDSFPGRPGEGG
jgi:hypothetical protein